MKKYYFILIFVCVIFSGFADDVATKIKYSNGIIFSWNKDKDDNYSYHLNSKPIGKNKAGIVNFNKELSNIPNYSFVIIRKLFTPKSKGRKYYKDSFNILPVKITKRDKSLSFVYLRNFSYNIKDIGFIYIKCDFPNQPGKWIYYLNSEKLGKDNLGFSNLNKKLLKDKMKFLFIVFEKQSVAKYCTPPLKYSIAYKKFFKNINELKCNYYLKTVSLSGWKVCNGKLYNRKEKEKAIKEECKVKYIKIGEIEKKLLQYKYVVFAKYMYHPSYPDSFKVYYIQDRDKIVNAVNWIKSYYPNKKDMDMCMLAIHPNSVLVFTNRLPKEYQNVVGEKGTIDFPLYYNFKIYRKKYFTEGQLKPLYKIFDNNGALLKLKGNPRHIWSSPPSS